MADCSLFYIYLSLKSTDILYNLLFITINVVKCSESDRLVVEGSVFFVSRNKTTCFLVSFAT